MNKVAIIKEKNINFNKINQEVRVSKPEVKKVEEEQKKESKPVFVRKTPLK